MAFGDADASTPAFVNVNANWTTTGGTSASFTPPSGSLVVLMVFSDTSAGANPGNETVSDTSGGAAWQFKIRRAKPDSGSQAGCVAWWEKAFTSSPGAITITVVGNATGAASGGFYTHVVAGCSGSEGHAEGSNTNNVVSLAITSTTNNARGIVAATDWNVRPNMTAGAGQTALLASAVGSGPDTRVYVGIQNAVTSPAGAVTMSTGSPNTSNANNFVGGFLVPSAAPSGVTPDGIAVATGLGSPTTTVPSAAPSGIAVTAGLGSPTVAVPSAAPSGIAVTAGLGSPTVALNRSAAPSGIAVPVAAGQPVAAHSLAAAPSGVAVAIALGSPRVVVGRVLVTRPDAGLVVRPGTGLVVRPGTGLVVRP